MTDAYEDVLLPPNVAKGQEGRQEDGNVVAASACEPAIDTVGEPKALETQLSAAEQRRQEFGSWLRHRTGGGRMTVRDSHSANPGGASPPNAGARAVVVCTSVTEPTAAGADIPSASTIDQSEAAATEDAVAAASAKLEGLRRSISSRRLQRGWRAFVQSKRTTKALAEAFVAQGVTNVRQAASPPPSPPSAAAAGASKGIAVPQPRSRLGSNCNGNSGGGAVPILIGLGSPRRPSSLSPGGRSGGGGHCAYEEEEEAGGDGFDRFAAALRSPATLKAAQALMRRLEQRLALRESRPTSQDQPPSGSYGSPPSPSQPSPQPTVATASDVSRLLRRLHPRAAKDAPLERYPPRVLLCAFMIVRHPEVVFSGAGEREAALATAASDLVVRLEALLYKIITTTATSTTAADTPSDAVQQPQPQQQHQQRQHAASAGAAATGTGSASSSSVLQPPPSPPPSLLLLSCGSPVARGMEELMRRRRAEATAAAAASTAASEVGMMSALYGPHDGPNGSGAPPPSPSSTQYMTIGSLLVSFDAAWCRYLDQFVAWKGADAAALESELVRCAVALESSMMRKCRGEPGSER
ncbi:hypothetical protein Agub_g5504, partial [Astrephomene gubernaculifera]